MVLHRVSTDQHRLHDLLVLPHPRCRHAPQVADCCLVSVDGVRQCHRLAVASPRRGLGIQPVLLQERAQCLQLRVLLSISSLSQRAVVGCAVALSGGCGSVTPRNSSVTSRWSVAFVIGWRADVWGDRVEARTDISPFSGAKTLSVRSVVAAVKLQLPEPLTSRWLCEDICPPPPAVFRDCPLSYCAGSLCLARSLASSTMNFYRVSI